MLDAPGIQASRGFNPDAAAGAVMQESVRSWQLLQLKAVIAFKKHYNLKAHTVNFRSSIPSLPGCQLLKGVGWMMSSDELSLICTYSSRLPLHESRPPVSMHASNFYPQVHTCPPPQTLALDQLTCQHQVHFQSALKDCSLRKPNFDMLSAAHTPNDLCLGQRYLSSDSPAPVDFTLRSGPR